MQTDERKKQLNKRVFLFFSPYQQLPLGSCRLNLLCSKGGLVTNQRRSEEEQNETACQTCQPTRKYQTNRCKCIMIIDLGVNPKIKIWIG